MAEVITRIARLAEDHPSRPGGEHAKIIRKTLHYLATNQDLMDYPRTLTNGWSIATGVIEGACRHLIADRMSITGARWGLAGAQVWCRPGCHLGSGCPGPGLVQAGCGRHDVKLCR